jgi:hypothetical protein
MAFLNVFGSRFQLCDSLIGPFRTRAHAIKFMEAKGFSAAGFLSGLSSVLHRYVKFLFICSDGIFFHGFPSVCGKNKFPTLKKKKKKKKKKNCRHIASDTDMSLLFSSLVLALTPSSDIRRYDVVRAGLELTRSHALTFKKFCATWIFKEKKKWLESDIGFCSPL